ncbi:MAG: hypothetical protein ACXWQR_03760, partial [Ktedonobacterales bacterium]
MLTIPAQHQNPATNPLQDWHPQLLGISLPGYIALFGITADTPEAVVRYLIDSLVPQRRIRTRKRGRPKDTSRAIPRDQFTSRYLAAYATLSAPGVK